MTTIQFEAGTFMVGDTSIASARIDPIKFLAFVAFVKVALAMKTPASFEGRLRRVRLTRQVKYFDGAGGQVNVPIEAILQQSVATGRKLSAGLDAGEGTAGSIIRDGDGVSSAIGYQLGDPIKTQGSKDGAAINEIEFLARTFGDLEEVLAAGDNLDQAAALIRNVAKPVHGTLQTMPSWAADQISIADGVTIANHVLPRFLEGS